MDRDELIRSAHNGEVVGDGAAMNLPEMNDLPKLTAEDIAAIESIDMTPILGTMEERLQVVMNAAIRFMRQRDEAQAEIERLRALAHRIGDHPLVMEQGGVDDADRCHRVINRQHAEIERLQSMRRQEASDWMDIDTECRTQAKRVLPPVLIDGDSGSVPSIGDVCERMSKEIERLRAELTRWQTTRCQCIQTQIDEA